MLPWLFAALLGVGGPQGTLTIQTNQITATMTSAKDWTLRTIEYEGTPILIDAGGEGAVICPNGGSWLGGGMAAEGELVDSLLINGDEVEELPAVPLGAGTEIEKISRLAGIKHQAVTRFDDDVIIQQHSFTFAEDQDLKSFYAFIYSFSPQFTHWMAERRNGTETAGEFASDNGRPLAEPVQWFALFNAEAGAGIIGYYQKPLAGSTTLWDTSSYRKFYIQPTSGLFEAGTELDGTLVFRCFRAEAETWQDAARQEVAALRERFPAQESAPQANRLYDEGVPEQGFLTVQTEHLRVPFEASSAWTIDEIWYDDFKVAGATGHYGTVLVPVGGNWIGTGHTEGGREVVHSLQILVDGKQQPVQIGTTVEADEFKLVKRSTIYKFDATHTVTVRSDEIVERAQLTATEDFDLKLMYLFMHCIEPATSRWIAETPDREIIEGTFESDKDFELKQKARWVAQWFPEQNLAVLLYLTRIPEPETAMVRIWDQPHYHKFYLQHNMGLSVHQGDELDFTLVLRVVPNETGDWEAVKAAAAELMERYPPADSEADQ